MDENEIYEILSSYKQALDMIIERIDQMDEMYHAADQRVDELEKTVREQVLDPINELVEEGEKNARFDEFDNKYGEKLSAFNDTLAPMEEEGFDLSRATFDAYDALPEDQRPDEEAYVNEVTRIAEEKINQIKEAFGIPSDTATEVTDDGDGNVEVKVDEDGDGEPETPVEEAGEEVSEETEVTDEPDGEEEVGSEESEEKIDDPEEIAKLEEELKKEL